MFEEESADVITDYQVNGKRSLRDVRRHFERHLSPFFTGCKMVNITTVDVRRYVAARQEAQASNATINRELAALKRAFSLGIEAGKLTVKPKIPMLQENNIRQGFFEPEQFEAVRGRLPAPEQALVSFAYITGWRVPSEVQNLQWRQVDFPAGRVRLEVGTTKNGEGRLFPMTQELCRFRRKPNSHSD